MLNVGDNPVKIRQGTDVGVVHPASVFQRMDENTSVSTGVYHESIEKTENDEIPEKLKEIVQGFL